MDYEEQVQKARESAEEEFREQFLSRLQENIKQAQTEFRELNRALKDIRFAHEQYEFQYAPRASAKKYYSMIMDDFNVMQGESIFSGLFNETHKEVIEELFEKLSLDDENSQKVLEEYTDYRTYMDYDIKITGSDGSYMYYSKVLREKSGGETQTPFYITIAASFMQLYRSSIGGDSIGLVMMDEAFNNMDDERIQGVLSFMRLSDLEKSGTGDGHPDPHLADGYSDLRGVSVDGKAAHPDRPQSIGENEGRSVFYRTERAL